MSGPSPAPSRTDGSALRIDVWSDIVCPWCYIGKRRLERALEAFPEGAVEIVWRSFELDPSAPTELPGPLDEELARKYGTSLEQAREMMDNLAHTAAAEGLEFNFEEARRGNTVDAHRVLHLAAREGLQLPMKERLLRAYMTEGRPISDRDELAALAAEVGLDGPAVRAMLDTDAFLADVRADEAEARRLGIRGVPFFVLDGRYGVSGAQPADLLADAIRQAASTRD